MLQRTSVILPGPVECELKYIIFCEATVAIRGHNIHKAINIKILIQCRVSMATN